MNRSTRSRLARARQNTPSAPPDLSAMTPVERLTWASELVGFDTLVRTANARRPKPVEAAGDEARAYWDDPELPPEVALPASPVAPASPPPPAPSPRHAGEPDPDYVPPPQNEYWEERCHFRVRGPDEPYDHDEPEQDEDDALIYGDE